jgi:anaerobic magnesium-protoporphyrin IX monomethyl ester cyclase
MNVAIVYPEVLDLARFKENRKEFPPFGALYLAAVIEQSGATVEILKISPGNTFLDLTRFDVVAFSIPSSATYGMIKDARFKSRYNDDPYILVGGVHPTFYPEETLIDIRPHAVGIGEGETTILELLEVKNSREFSKISGICYLANGIPTRTQPRALVKDISLLPNPARHLLDLDDFVMSDRLSNLELQMAHVMFSRGCPFPCRFCAAAQTQIQYRSGQSARTELIELRDRYKIEGFAIVDDNFIVNKKKVQEICHSIRDLQLRWSALSRVDTVDESLLLEMRRAGCIEVKYGMESGSPQILRAMKKNITPNTIEKTVTMTKNCGINVKLFIIHGFPGENLATTKETIKLLERLVPFVDRVSLFRFVPLPGTYIFEHAAEFQIRGTNQSPDWDGDWEKYHIHHNNRHWWGTTADFEEVNTSYQLIHHFVDAYWPQKYKGF